MAYPTPIIERRIFAEELLSFIYRRQGCEFHLGERLAPEAQRAYKAFDITMEKAVTNIERNLKIQQDVSDYMQNIDVNDDTFQNLERRLVQKYFPNGFNPHSFYNFLPFCVYIAVAGAYFCGRGLPFTKFMAMAAICSFWNDYGMGANRWKDLNNIAERYASMPNEHPNMTLESTKILSSDQAKPEDSAYQNAAENVGNAINENSNSIDVAAGMGDVIEES